jgi:Spy/CpxP family protein refolding chaperone
MKGLANSLAALAMAVVLAGSVHAAAQPGEGLGPVFSAHRGPMERMLGPEGPGGRWWNNPKIVDQLKLTDDQRKDMDQILLQHRESLIDLHANLEKAELAMEPLLNADQPNEQAVLAQIDQIAQARAELEKANARFLLAIRAKLTPDQYKQLKTLREERGMRQFRMRGRPNRGAPNGSPEGPPSSDSQPQPPNGPGAAPPLPGPEGAAPNF